MLHVTSDLQVGGAGRYLLNLLPGLAKEGWEVSVACPGGGELEQELRRHGFHPHRLSGADASWSWPVLGQVYALLARENYQVVHTHASLAGRVAARLAHSPKIVLTRHRLGARKEVPKGRRYLNTWANTLLTDRIIAISQAVAVGLVNEGVLPEQIRVIPNGIAVEEFSNCSGAAVRMELGVGSRPLVGMVARLVPEKAPENVVQAAALIKQQRPDCMFVMVGTGPLKQRLTDLAQELNLHQEFKFLGYRPDIAAVTSALDVAVLTSCQEGQGLVLLEAMAAGKPLVATAVGGITEVVQPKHTGLLVPPGMPQAVAQAVLQLLEHEEQALAMGRAGQELVRRQFSQAAMAQRTAELYRELVES
ncbi:MAG: glycosyltransferase [bacterium]